MPDTDRTLAETLRLNRLSHDLTCRELEFLAGLARGTVLRLEHGTVDASEPIVERLEAVLGCSLT